MASHFVAVGPHNKRIGIVSASYKEFVRKCRKKFNIQKKEICVTLDDDTEVDEEYFEVLQNGTDLYIKTQETETPSDSLHPLATFLHKCLLSQPKIHDKVSEYLHEPEQAKLVLELLAQIAETSTSSTKRDDNLEWFKGLNTRFKTKEAVMRNSAESRMRGYLDHTKKMLLTDDLPPDSPCKYAITFFKEQLSKSKYNSDYFDRSAGSDASLCDEAGVFECEGPYNQSKCEGIHIINPYNSREARIVFSTWNLDHVIEKSRTILPVLKKVLEGPRSSDVNLPYFHKLLFLHQCSKGQSVSGNLKLVHIACHDKKPHDIQCKSSEIYKKNAEMTENGIDARGNSDDTTDGFQFQPHMQAGVITRQRRKRSCQESYVGRQKRPRLVKNDMWQKGINSMK